jgi:hypothetical protein
MCDQRPGEFCAVQHCEIGAFTREWRHEVRSVPEQRGAEDPLPSIAAHAIMPLTPDRIATVPHARLTEVTERLPISPASTGLRPTWTPRFHREWELSLGRRTARAKLAMLLCELLVWPEIVGLTERLSDALPLTQTDLGDCTGYQRSRQQGAEGARARELVEF